MIWVPMMMYVEGMDLELVIVERESLNLNLLDLERLREFKKDFLCGAILKPRASYLILTL